MLEMPMTNFASRTMLQAFYVHPIVVDQFDSILCHHQIAILDVTVCDAVVLQICCESLNFGSKLRHGRRVTTVLIQVDAQCVSLYPIHAYDGIETGANANS